jgi:hypothetical protein
MDPVVVAFGAALVSAMATDTWEQARTVVAALWRRVRPPEDAEMVTSDLEALRERMVIARQHDRADVEDALAVVWQGRVQELLLDDPGLAAELRLILDETLTPMLTPTQQVRIGQITMTGTSYDNSTFNQFIGDQHNARP